MLRSILFGIVVLATVLNSSLWTTAEPTWTSLRVTWGLNLFSSRVFAKLPRTESKARSQGFVKLSGECSEGKFLGSRYIKGQDTAVVMLYDTKGIIAGIQNGIPKSDVDQVNTSFSFEYSTAYQADIFQEEIVYFLTTYFVDPTIICNDGRTREELDEQGTGTGLYIQNGRDPIKDSTMVPLYEAGMNVTHWVQGGCFTSMGQHYWLGATEDMSCRDFFPYTIIYNRGKLTSFAFANIGNYEFSTRFEHPPKSALTTFLPTPVPQCLYNEYESAGGFSTMHVYFSVRPWNVFC